MPFDQPSSGTWLKPADHAGHLLLITACHGVEKAFDTMKNGEVDKATIDIVDLDENPAVLATNVANSHPGIVGKLGKLLRGGNPVLGRLTQVPTSKGNPAWVLSEYQPGDDARAEAWLKANPTSTFAQPAAAATAPPPAVHAAPAQASTPAPMVTLPDGSQVTPEVAALLGQLGSTPAA